MGAKDVVEKTLEEYNDVFADIVNVLLFHGQRIIKEDELDDALPRSPLQSGFHNSRIGTGYRQVLEKRANTNFTHRTGESYPHG